MKIIQSKKENNSFWKEIKLKDIQDYSLQIKVNSSKEFQTIIGFGGAFTESSAFNLFNMSKKKQIEAINAYFSNNGLAYNLGRVHINSCDFSLNNYTYIDENDKDLKSFCIDREKKYVIPMLKKAKALRNDLRILASPWSPCAFMKDTNQMNGGGKLKKEHRQLWANYYLKYLEEMQKNGIIINAISVQNEPLAKQTWDSCIYEKEEERDFVKNYLGPTLYNSIFKDVHIYVWDHNRGVELKERVDTILSDKEASQYVYGVAFHWYCNEDFESLSYSAKKYQDKKLLFTEGCVEYGIYGEESKLRFENGEFYAHHMINDFNNYSTGFIDWNLILDINGGPNHVGNFCEAPIMYDKKNDKVIYNSSYYFIGHFSKYVKRGAKRIETIQCSNKNVECVSFKNPDSSIVIIILNRSKECNLCLSIDNDTNLVVSIPEHSITTIIN